ncbi:MAG: hypothetical protein ACLRSW_00415 [Christensenellaceae bacterium]
MIYSIENKILKATVDTSGLSFSPFIPKRRRRSIFGRATPPIGRAEPITFSHDRKNV